MRVLVVGHKGQLGCDMMKLAAQAGHETCGVDVPEIDICDIDATRRHVDLHCPDVIINCAAYTAVDACESNQQLAFAVNAQGAQHLAHAARHAGASLVHFSTDYVFDGSAEKPYVETDNPRPLSVYGMSKLEGERLVQDALDRHFIFRISWLYGTTGKNFVKTIRRVAQQKHAAGEVLRVVSDQTGTPTYTVDVCRQILAVMTTCNFGLYHCTSEGACTWYVFARHILKESGIDADIVPCATSDYPLAATRPQYSVLENKKLKDIGMNIMPDWRQGFKQFLAEENSAMPGASAQT